ncbi:Hypothetical protein CINCED_3A004489 [Cinara cedri]|nr:Hypothetical protein CINCED_3A004489 [Cinara cedri]
MSKFTYFAYGSNMLMSRIHLNNPSAVRIGIGKLNEYRLDFSRYSKKWDGSVATVVPDHTEYVWGVLWQLNKTDMANLDKQEGVGHGVYKVFNATVTFDEKNETCRCYMLVEQPKKENPIPPERRPSKAYLRTMINGANESNIPLDYVQFLNDIPNNGKDGPKELHSLKLTE